MSITEKKLFISPVPVHRIYDKRHPRLYLVLDNAIGILLASQVELILKALRSHSEKLRFVMAKDQEKALVNT